MGSETNHDDRHAAPTPPEITADAILDLFERALSDETAPAVMPEPPEITADDIHRMFADAGWVPSEAERVDTAPETPVRDADPIPATTPTLREVQCPSCYGSGTQLCTSCYGSGSQTTSYTTTDWEGNVEYVTDQYPCGCSAGTVTCAACGGRGVVSR